MGIAIPQVITPDRATGAQVIDGSLRFDSTKSHYLNKTPESVGNRKTWTWSGWVKKTRNAIIEPIFYALSGADYGHLYFASNDTIQFDNNGYYLTSTAVYRDNASWYHVVLQLDSTQVVAADRAKLYVNGVQVSITFPLSDIPLNYDGFINTTVSHRIGASAGAYSSHYLADIHFIDGQALGPEYFGYTDPLTNTWRPKKYDTTAPTNNPNNNTTWSDNVSASSGGFGTGEEATKGFDGSTSTKCKTNTNGASITITFSGVTVEKLLRIRTNYTNGANSSITVNGTNYGAAATASDGAYKAINGFTGELTSIVLAADAAVNAAFSVIEVDGVILQDSTTTNNRTWNSSITFGTNGFHLPMDGNSSIGQDKSGNGNDWTPVNFGGSNTLEKATGALPILNTLGGTVARPGVFGSEENKYYTVTTADGSVYQFDITSGDNPSLSFIRGATYKFDYSSFTGHPVLFSSTNPDSSTTAYTDGTSIASNVISFTVPHDAPDTLYYYCQNHPTSMNGSISITTDTKKADPYAWKNVLALPLVGVKDDVSASINCTSTTKTTTVSGNAASNSASSNFYGSSFYFDGTDDYHDSTITALASRDFTIEFWFMSTATDGYQTLFEYGDHTSNGIYITLRDGDAIGVRSYNGQDISNATIASPSHNTPKDRWHHIAVTRESNTAKLFINGKYIGNKTWSTSYTPTTVRLGHSIYSAGSSEDLTGYIQDVRIYDGAVKYTGTTVNEQSFVVPSTSPDILPDTPSGVSGSSKLTKITDGAVSFDGTGDYLSIADSADFELGSGDFTLEAYVYQNNAAGSASDSHNILNKWDNSGTTKSYAFRISESSGQKLQFFWSTDGTTNNSITSSDSLSINRWHHVAVVNDGGTLTLYIDGRPQSTTGSAGTLYNSSVDFLIGRTDADSGSQYFDGFISNARVIKGTALYTTDFTPPTAPLTNVTNTKLLCCQKEQLENNFIRMFKSSTLYTTKADILANATEIGDGASLSSEYWYIVPTGGEPIGSDVFTNDGSVTTPHGSNNFALYWRNGSSWTQTIGTYGPSEYSDFDYKSDDSSSTYSVYPARDFYVFGADDSPSEPKLISGTLPTRAKYYTITGAVKPGTITANGNAAATNFNPFTTDINAVRGQESGYATLSPVRGYLQTLSNGNLTGQTAGGWVGSTVDVSSGKYYVEFIPTSNTIQMFGICSSEHTSNAYPWQTAASKDVTYYVADGRVYVDAVNTGTTSAAAVGDTISLSLDTDSRTVQIRKNNILISTKTISQSTSYMFYLSDGGGTSSATVNFGQKPFKFPPPDGFQPLNAANVRPSTVIARPDHYVGIVTYTGNSSTNVITGLGFSPDFLWIKARTVDGYDSRLIDSVRGADKLLYSSLTSAEATGQTNLTSFDSNGFTLGANSQTNLDTYPFIAWCWKAGGGTGITTSFWKDDVEYGSASAAGLDGGSITPTGASVGTKQGFSIITYTGNTTSGGETLAHGLNETPKMVHIKRRDSAYNWISIITDSSGQKKSGYLDLNNALGNDNSSWDSNVITLSSSPGVISNGGTYVAYCWAPVEGYSSFGSYTGNGLADGPFVYTGFKPSWLMIKIATGTDSNWVILDSSRDTSNVVENNLYADTTDAENQFDWVDFLSNGFKVRSTLNQANGSTYTYVYAAFAEAPTVNLYGAQSNAR